MNHDPLYGWPDTNSGDEDDSGKEPRAVNPCHAVRIEGLYFPRKRTSTSPEQSGDSAWLVSMMPGWRGFITYSWSSVDPATGTNCLNYYYEIFDPISTEMVLLPETAVVELFRFVSKLRLFDIVKTNQFQVSMDEVFEIMPPWVWKRLFSPLETEILIREQEQFVMHRILDNAWDLLFLLRGRELVLFNPRTRQQLVEARLELSAQQRRQYFEQVLTGNYPESNNWIKGVLEGFLPLDSNIRPCLVEVVAHFLELAYSRKVLGIVEMVLELEGLPTRPEE